MFESLENQLRFVMSTLKGINKDHISRGKKKKSTVLDLNNAKVKDKTRKTTLNVVTEYNCWSIFQSFFCCFFLLVAHCNEHQVRIRNF